MALEIRMYKETLSIDNVHNLTGIPKSTLRFWEKVFSGYLKPARTKGRQRRYTREDLEKILNIKKLLEMEGYTIAGARRKLVA